MGQGRGLGWAALAGAVSLVAACSDPVAGGALQYVNEDVLKMEPDASGADVAVPDAPDASPDAAPPECTAPEDCGPLGGVDTCWVPVCRPDGTCGIGPAPAGTACEDGNPCTVGDACDEGACVGGTNVCPCDTAEDCAGHDDGDACNGTLSCVGGHCEVDPLSVVTCAPSGGPCEAVRCEPATGQCVTEPAPDGTACDDGDACTGGDRCLAGACEAGAPLVCPPEGPCSVAHCDPAAGCVQTAAEDGTACDDGNPCTSAETCAAGSCGGGVSLCACEIDADCAAYQTDACLAALVCVAGECVVGLGQPVTCAPSDDPCRVSHCDPTTGACVSAPAPDGTVCADPADVCTAGATCVAGVCVGPEAPCDDGNPCTSDACHPVAGCSHLPLEGGCDDGNPCTADDACVAGVCQGAAVCACQDDEDCRGEGFDACLGSWRCADGFCVAEGGPVDCGALDGPCVAGACDPATGACVAQLVVDGTPCDDGDPCSDGTVCAAGVCGGGETRVCDDGNPCTDDVCQAGVGCVHKPNTAPCDDGNPCTTGDTCAAGSCKGGVAVVCQGGGPCTKAVCDTVKGCGVVPRDDGTPCDDGSACTEGDACLDGACVGASVCACEVDEDCGDDGNACNGKPRCVAGACVVDPATVVTCATAGACQVASCDPATGQCVTAPVADGTACPAGPCKKVGACLAGACVAVDVDCDDGNPCTADSCDPATGQCVNAAVDGGACDDGDPCTLASVCQAGSCVGTQKNTCDDGDACTVDVCKPGVGCQHAAAECDDGDACTTDACDPKTGCTFTPKACAVATTPCTVAACDPATGQCQTTPAPVGAPCDDGDPCTGADACHGGACQGEPLACDDGDPCTTDACGASGCVHTPIAGCGVDPACQNKPGGAACNDGDPATVADMCIAGKCRGYVLHRAEGDALNLGHVAYHAVDHAYGKLFVAASASPSWTTSSTYGILDATNPAAPVPYDATLQTHGFRDLRGGFAVDTNARLWVYDGTTWSSNGPLSNALTASGSGSLYGVWSQTNDVGQRTVWVVGSASSQPYVRRCTEVGSVTCVGQGLGTNQARLPRAVAGFQTCGASGCTTHLALGADQSAGGGYYYNHVYVNPTGSQSPWSLGYGDTGAQATQTRAMAAYGDGRYVLVGTGGLMRFRAANGTWGNVVTVQNGQSSRTFTGAWIGADVVVLSAWRTTGSQRVFELWTADRSANGAASASWTIHQLGTDGSGNANLADVRGRPDGTVYAVGTGRGSDFYLDGLLFVRAP